MHVPTGPALDDEPDGSTHLECRDANAVAHARFERLCRDLSATQKDDRVDCLERDSLTTLRQAHQQRAPAVLHAGAVISNVDGAQVAHSNTTLAM